MNDRLGHVEVTTNGTRKVTDAEPPENAHEAPRPLNGQFMEERLDTLMETIRAWDWRAAPVEADPPPANETASTISALTATAPAEHREQPAVVHEEPAVVSEESVVVPEQPAVVREDSEPLTHDPSPVRGAQDTQPVVIEPLAPQATAEPSVPEKPESAIDGASSSPVPGPRHRHRAKARPGAIRRLWEHRWTRMAVLCLAAAVAVVLIIWGIRLTHKDPGSNGPTLPPASTTTTRPATSQTAQTVSLAPIDSAQLAQYEQYAAGLQTANEAASKEFGGAGSTPTATQLASVAAAYRAAVNVYDFQLHFIQWPVSMQAAIATDHAQLQALMSSLQSISSVSSTGTSAWLAQLHDRTDTAQTADNQVRKDLGLHISTSFP